MSEVNYMSLFTLCAMCVAGTAAAGPIVFTTGHGATNLLSRSSPEFAVDPDGLNHPAAEMRAADWFRSVAHEEPQHTGLDSAVPLDKSREATSPRGLFDASEEVAAVQSPTIPEPATLVLLGTGLFVAGFGARHLSNRASARERRRRSAARSQTPLP